MKISELMIRDVESCSPRDSLETAAGKLWNRDIGCLPVVNTGEEVIGMITDRDICMAAYTQGKPLNEIAISIAMSPDVFFTVPEATIVEAEKTMRLHQVRRLPVLNAEKKLVGIVSLNDLAREAEREVGRKNGEISSKEIMDTLAAVCEPRAIQVQVH